MRNLKKVLALVLALMMTISLMATASAATYNDEGDINYDEAVAVMSAIGVFNGTDGGNFDPNGNLTRAQAAKIITYMLLGQTVADALPNTGSTFADCPDGQWYVGSVNYLTDLGIISGRSASVFDPKGNVTGLEFAKMLLGALGYKADKEGMEGTSSWSTNIAILARGAGLDTGMTTSVLNSNALTRQQACQMAFNAEKGTVQYYKDSWGVTTPDGTTVNVPADRLPLANNTGKDYANRSSETTMQFCEMYCPELKLNSQYRDPDSFGRQSSGQWLVGNDVVHTNYNKLAAVFTGPAGVNDVRDALAGYTLQVNNTNGNVIPYTTTSNGLVVNGVGIGSTSINAIADTDEAAKNGINEITAAGRQVEVYADDDNVITQIIVITYTLDGMKRISTAANGNVTYVFDGGASKLNKADNTQTEVALEGDVAAGDVITRVQDQDGVWHVYPTTAMTGAQTVFNNTSKVVTINGEKYAIGIAVTGVDTANTTNFPNSNTDATYYLDVNGFIVKRVGPAAADNFVMITDVVGTLSGSVNGTSAYVELRGILSDGTVGVYNLEVGKAASADASAGIEQGDWVCGDVEVANKDVNTATAFNTALQTSVHNQVFQYSFNDKGELVLSKLANGNNTVTADKNNTYTIGGKTNASNPIDGSNKGYTGGTSHKTASQSATALMSGNTVFVLISGSGSQTAATVVTGTSGLKLAANGSTGTAVITGSGSSGTAKVVFLGVEAPAAEIVDYVYITFNKYEEAIDKDGAKLRQYTGIAADGSEVTVFGPSEGKVLIADGLYAYDEDNMVSSDSKKAIASDTTLDTTSEGSYKLFACVTPVAEANGALMNVAGAHYHVTADTNVVYIDQAANGWDGNVCYVVLNSKSMDTVDAIFIVDARAVIGGSYAAVNKTDCNSSTATGTANFTPASFAPATGITAADFTYTVQGDLPAGITGVDFDENGNATITGNANVTNGTITVLVAPAETHDANLIYRPTTKTITVTMTGSWGA